jgi:hypothetical protein
MKFTIVLKILDFIHDLLCPFFGNDQKVEKPKEENKEK